MTDMIGRGHGRERLIMQLLRCLLILRGPLRVVGVGINLGRGRRWRTTFDGGQWIGFEAGAGRTLSTTPEEEGCES